MSQFGKRAMRCAAAIGAGLIVLSAGQSFAASRVCRQLEAELASAGRGGAGQAKKYERAIATQR